MAEFPVGSTIFNTDPSWTAAQAVNEFQKWLTATRQLPGGNAPESLTIATGQITPTRGMVIVDTEGAAAADDLTTIAAASVHEGALLYLRAASSARAVTVKHGTGVGGISLLNTADVRLSDTYWLVLRRTTDRWVEVATLRANTAQDIDLGSGLTAKGAGQLGFSAVGSLTDADAYTTPGFYYIDPAKAVAKWPVAGTGGHLMVNASSTGYIRQVLTHVNSTRTFIRTRTTAGVWTSWLELPNSSDLGKYNIAYRTGATIQALAANTWTAIERGPTPNVTGDLGATDTGLGLLALRVPESGRYLVHCYVAVSSSASGNVLAGIAKNGTLFAQQGYAYVNNGLTGQPKCIAIIDLAANDTIGARAFCSVAGSVNSEGGVIEIMRVR